MATRPARNALIEEAQSTFRRVCGKDEDALQEANERLLVAINAGKVPPDAGPARDAWFRTLATRKVIDGARKVTREKQKLEKYQAAAPATGTADISDVAAVSEAQKRDMEELREDLVNRFTAFAHTLSIRRDWLTRPGRHSESQLLEMDELLTKSWGWLHRVQDERVLAVQTIVQGLVYLMHPENILTDYILVCGATRVHGRRAEVLKFFTVARECWGTRRQTMAIRALLDALGYQRTRDLKGEIKAHRADLNRRNARKTT